MAVLALEKNSRLARLIVNRENHDGPGMADDIAAGANAARLFDFVGGDVEDGSVICDARREDSGLR